VAADVVEEHVDALTRSPPQALRERGIAVVDRDVGAQHLLGMIGATPAAGDGHDARAGVGELDRHPAHGAGGGADEHAAACPHPAYVVDAHVGSHAGRVQHADPLQRPAEGRFGDLGRRDRGRRIGLPAGVGRHQRAYRRTPGSSDLTTTPTLLAGTGSPTATGVTSDEPRSIRSW
jgi:hypothetical protein